ncbi:MAG: putative PEP-binding protein [Methanobacteriaceae archaeon]
MIILRGIGTSPYTGVGRVKKIEKKEDLLQLEGGEIVVLSRAARDMLSHLQRAGGVVTDYGGLTSHVAIVLREMKVACVVGTEIGTQMLQEGLLVTVDGNTGNIYRGFVEMEHKDGPMEIHHPATSVKVNINIPEIAEKIAPLADGVGSIRIENLIIRTGMHPQKLQKQNKLDKVIADGIRIIADAFHPKSVYFRTFDIPTDELRGLDGGKVEPHEHNPLLGLRGIQKDLQNREILESELRAITRLLDEGYDNIGVKIPFLRDLSEYKAVKSIMMDVGLRPHRDIPLGVALETPSSFLIFDEFIKEGLDFVTLGMSDLTMCTLAVDRRGVKVAKHFDLTHPAVWKMLDMVIQKCNYHGLESCICGHSASNPAIVRRLIDLGISSISTNPDQILKMRKVVSTAEYALLAKYLRF